MLNKKSAIRTALAVSVAGLLGSTAAVATDFNGTASVAVATGVTIVETSGLNFGTLGVINSTNLGAATVVTMAAGTGVLTSDTVAEIIVIADGTPLELAVTSGPPSAVINLSGTPSGTLTGTGSNSTVTLNNFIADSPLLTDANGGLNVKFGADLVFGIASTYGAGSYTGSYTVTLTF